MFFRSFHSRIDKIFQEFYFLKQKQLQTMALIDDLTTSVDAFKAAAIQKAIDVEAALKALKDQIAAGSPATTEQLQTVIDGVAAAKTALDAIPTA